MPHSEPRQSLWKCQADGSPVGDWTLGAAKFEQDVGLLNQHMQQEAHQQRYCQIAEE